MLLTKHLDAPFIKATTAEGTFEGLLSPYNYVDSGGDLVEKGAYQKTLAEKGPRRPLLWQHQSDMPIGELTLEDRADGLWAKGKLLMSLPEAQKAYALIKSGIVSGLSIGYQTVRDTFEGGVRHLKELRLFEGSICTFPMAEAALITSVKSTDDYNKIRKALSDLRRSVLAGLEGN